MSRRHTGAFAAFTAAFAFTPCTTMAPKPCPACVWLDRGGSCVGVAFRSAFKVGGNACYLREREQVSQVYWK